MNDKQTASATNVPCNDLLEGGGYYYRIARVEYNSDCNGKAQADELQRIVNNLIKAGFRPMGGIAIESWESGCTLMQAMICERPSNDEAQRRP